MADSANKTVAIIGAGAAGLMAADHLSQLRPDLAITLYDAMPSPARKILMAGKSGLNISHEGGLKAPAQFASHYGKAESWMTPMLADFGPAQILDWMKELDQTHFVGSSGRIFPKAMKASPLLRALMKRLDSRGVKLFARHRWIGWDEQNHLVFDHLAERVTVRASASLLTMGGPSWPKLGTDGAFLVELEKKGIACNAFKPANCGFDADWPEAFVAQWAGQPVKSVRLTHRDKSVLGDFIITRNGIEGGSVYALSADLRDAIEQDGFATLQIDLRPNQTRDVIYDRLSKPRGKQSWSNHLRRAVNLKGSQAALLKAKTDKAIMVENDKLADAIKSLPIRLERPRPIEEAISTAGGVKLSELDDNLMVQSVPGLFLAGEMLDWEAPTGGYLLTACLSQGFRAAQGVNLYL